MFRFCVLSMLWTLPILGVFESSPMLDLVSDVGIASGFLWFLDRHDRRINETIRLMSERGPPAEGADLPSME